MEYKTAKSIVDENFKGLSDFIKDEDLLLWYKDLIQVCLEEYASQAVRLALGEVVLLSNAKFHEGAHWINDDSILSLADEIIAKLS